MGFDIYDKPVAERKKHLILTHDFSGGITVRCVDDIGEQIPRAQILTIYDDGEISIHGGIADHIGIKTIRVNGKVLTYEG